MDYQDRENLIQQIVNGKLLVEYKKNLFVFVEPNKDILFSASCFYYQCYRDYINNELFLSDEEEQKLLISECLWNKDSDLKLKELNDNINKLKNQRSQYKYQSNKLLQIDRLINVTESEIKKMLLLKNTFLSQTARYQAGYLKNGWLVSQCLYNVELKKIWSSYQDFENEHDIIMCDFFIRKLFYEGVVNDKDIRKIARSEPWRTKWKTSCKLSIPIFGDDITLTQFHLCYWSNVYDSIYDSMDCPPFEVIEDDDLINEWLRSQTEKHNIESRKKYNTDRNPPIRNAKIANAQEVFIKVDSQKDAEKVYDTMNLPDVRRRIQQRQQYILERGRVKEGFLPDVQRDLNMRRVQLMREHVKKK